SSPRRESPPAVALRVAATRSARSYSRTPFEPEIPRRGISGCDFAELRRLGEGAQLLQALVLDLPDPLACDVERPPHLVERPRMLAVQPVAQLEHAALAVREHPEDLLQRLLAERGLGRLVRQRLRLVEQEVAELGLFLVADRLLERDDEAEVRLDHLLLRPVVAALDPLRELDLLRGREQVDAADVLEEELQRIGGDLAPVRGHDLLLDGQLFLFHVAADDVDLELLELRVEVVELSGVEVELVERERDLLGGERAGGARGLEQRLRLDGLYHVHRRLALDPPLRCAHRAPLLPSAGCPDPVTTGTCLPRGGNCRTRAGQAQQSEGLVLTTPLGHSQDGRGSVLLPCRSGRGDPRARPAAAPSSPAPADRSRAGAARGGNARSQRAGSA